jgi:serine/alanine adding enzyme
VAGGQSGAGVTVELFQGTAEAWDGFVSQQVGFTHFHRYSWKRLIEEVFGHETRYCITRDGDRITAALPLVRVKSRLFGHYLVSMPFLNSGGPLGEPEGISQLVATATAEAKRSGAGLLELRSRIELPIDLPASHRKITVTLALPGDPERLLQSFGSKLRNQVRRADREAVTVRFGPEQVGPFFEVFSRHMRDLGTPTLPRKFFEAIAAGFPDDSWFGCAWLGERPIAGGAGFRWGDEFEMTWASSLLEFSRIAPNMLLYWSFMTRSIECGVRTFNFGRCTPGSGTHRFKQQWGGQDQPLFWYQWSRSGTASTPSPDQGRFSWGPRLWRHLPLPVSRLLGPWIVKSIP